MERISEKEGLIPLYDGQPFAAARLYDRGLE